MKRTAIMLTEKNINQIVGRLKKFFHCGEKQGKYIFSERHDFDNSWGSSSYNEVPFYYHIPEITIKDKGISIVYGVGIGGLYPFGTRFKFMGSTLKVQSPWSIGESKYCYDTFMVIPNPTYAQLMKADKDSVDEFYLENDIDEYYYDSDVEQD